MDKSKGIGKEVTNERLFSQVFDAVQDLLIVIDKDLRVVVSNWKGHEYIPEEDRQGHPHCHVIFMNRQTPCEHCPAREVFATGNTKELEHRNPVDGRISEIRIIPILDEEGKVVQVIEHLYDISRHKQIEETLIESEKRHREIVENAGEAIIVAQDGMLKLLNPKAQEITGYTREELTHIPFKEYIHPDDREMVLQRHQLRLKGDPAPTRYPFRIIDKNGNEKWIELTAVRIDWEGRAATLNFLNDITDRKRAEEILQKNEATVRTILDASPIGFIKIQDRIIEWANRAFYVMLGYEEGVLTGKTIQAIQEDHRDFMRMGLELYRQVRGKGIGKAETRWVNRDGRVMDCYVQATLLDQNDPYGGIILSVSDITARKRTEEQIRALNRKLMIAQEEERQMISRELHDRLGQDLSSVKLFCSTLFDHYPEVPLAVRERVSDISRILDETIKSVRDLSYDLRPPELDHLGLIQTISKFCDDFSKRYGLVVEFSATGIKELNLDFDTEINLYRLVQEGLNNIQKHAEAKKSSVKLVATYPLMLLRIEDNGRGFDVERRLDALTDEKRMGLRSMEERVKLLGGTMNIKSLPGMGTKIFIQIPCEETMGDSEEGHTDR